MKIATLTLLAAVLVPATALAYSVSVTESGYVIAWPTATIEHQFNAAGPTSRYGSTTTASAVAAVRASAADWNNLACSSLTMNESGTTTQTGNVVTDNTTDDINRWVWIGGSRWDFGDYVLGVTSPVFDGDGRIFEADIAFNDTIYWNTGNASGSATDVKSVAIHEIGHYFGLGHVLDFDQFDPETMAPTVDPDNLGRTLTTDDQRGACFLYPQSPPFSCSGNDQCPRIIDQNRQGEFYAGQSTCSGGRCGDVEPVPPGTGQLGETCTSPSDCANPLFCVGTSATSGVCAQDCNPSSNNCPTGFSCAELQDGSGACIDNELLGCQCDTTNACQSGCACDPDCGAACTCDTTNACQSGCGCDDDCSATCACNDTNACEAGCACDPNCAGFCACDTTTACTEGCSCDAECGCACDSTTSCDDDASGDECACDPECDSGGCAQALPSKRSNGNLVPLAVLGLSLLLAGLVRGRRRVSRR